MNDQNYPQNQHAPQGQPPYPPQGNLPPGGYAYPPQKKKHTLRNVLLVLALLFVLVVGGCLALVGGVANEIDKSIKDEEKNNTPTAVTEGEAFTHDNFAADAGWKVAKDALGDVTIKGLKITNKSEENQRTALLDFTFYQGTENLAEVTCSSNEIQAGESSKLDCFSADDFPAKYDSLKVADSF